MDEDKLIPLESLSSVLLGKVPKDSKVVLCHGVFDLLHPGHIKHLSEAKSHGDLLVVTVTSDRYVNKGPGRPYFTAEDRALMLASLEIVNLVSISDFPDALPAIDAVKPDIYAKGPDYAREDDDLTGKISIEKSRCEEHGGKVLYTSAPTMSSSSLRNEMIMNDSGEFSEWLPKFRMKSSNKEVASLFASIENLKVLVLGEGIIDEYVMVEALGKSSKDPVLAFKTGERERQLGGSFAVAKHALGLGAQVSLVTRIGLEQEFANLVKENLPGEISLKLLKSKTDPTLVKTRYVDELTKSKVFETYQIGELVATNDDDEELAVVLADLVNDVDVILVADYGHGLISQTHLDIVTNSSAVKAVNTQSNAGNRGFNSISRYGSVDIVCLNGSEVGLELKKRHVPLEVLVRELAERTQASFTAVTNGVKGVVYLDSRDSNGVTQSVPAFSTKVTDRVGAGDALFVASALSWTAGNSGLLSAVLGNLAGAASLAGLGNQVTIDRISLQKHMSALLK